MVPLSDSLAPSSTRQFDASRFAGGPLSNARLIIPTLFQQAQLKPGDVIEDVPLNSRAFTQEELLEIDRRADQLGELSIQEPAEAEVPIAPVQFKPSPLVKEASAQPAPPKQNGTLNVVGDIQERMATSTPAEPPSAPSAKAKRVSRFKAARAAGDD
jgi:hypothetical protein